MNLVKTVKNLWNKLPDGVKRVIHTLWQALLSAILVGITAAHGSPDLQTALFTIYATGWAALKSSVLKLAQSKVTGR